MMIKEKIKQLKEKQINSFDDFYNIVNEFDELIENNIFTVKQWEELYDINEKIIIAEKEYLTKENEKENFKDGC